MEPLQELEDKLSDHIQYFKNEDFGYDTYEESPEFYFIWAYRNINTTCRLADDDDKKLAEKDSKVFISNPNERA